MSDRIAENSSVRKYPLNMLYFYLTEGCNLRCRHCWIAPKYQTEEKKYPALSVDRFQSIIKQAKPLGLSGVKLTGGEPLLHPEIRELIRIVKEENLGLTIETNGVLCTEEMVREIVSTKIDNRLPFVSVSLDGADPETNEWVRGVKGCFQAAIEGIKNLVAAGFRPQVIMTLMRRNKDQMEAIVRLAESLGAGSVKFNIMQPTARGEEMHHRGEALTIDEYVELGRWVENGLSSSTKLRLIYHHPTAFRPLGKMFGETGDGCSRCGIFGILGVLANGSYALCGIGETVPELVFGHVDTLPLADVWNNHPILIEIREGLPNRLEGICGDCLMKSLCLGSCIAQNYYSSKNLMAPFWYCEEAREKGLFPETRLKAKPIPPLPHLLNGSKGGCWVKSQGS